MLLLLYFSISLISPTLGNFTDIKIYQFYVVMIMNNLSTPIFMNWRFWYKRAPLQDIEKVDLSLKSY